MRIDFVFLIEPNKDWHRLLAELDMPADSELSREYVWIQEFPTDVLKPYHLDEYCLDSVKLHFMAYVLSYLVHAKIPLQSLSNVNHFDTYWSIRLLKGEIVESKHIEGDLVPEVLNVISKWKELYSTSAIESFSHFASKVTTQTTDTARERILE